jgi:N-acyl-D-amino-acid deacylase
VDNSFDITISGQVYDGRGNVPKSLSIGIQNGIISYMGENSVKGRIHIDATRYAVAPGFIDVHTHSDISLLLDGRGESKIHQGVTTEVTGNCSFSAFPINSDFRQEHSDFLAGIGDDHIALAWDDLNGYREVMERSGIAINIAPLVGHGTLRIAAMGLKEGIANAADLARMAELLTQMLEQGAFGMSTGLTYVPSRYASFEELRSLCNILRKADRIYTSHARDYDILGDNQFLGPLNEALQLAKQSGVRIQYSHAAINDPSLWGSAGQWVDFFESSLRDGIEAAFDVYPYDASSSALTQYLPAWVQGGGVEAMSHRLADSATMERAEVELAQGWSANKIPWIWDRVVLARTDGLLNIQVGDSLKTAAEKLQVKPEWLVLELCRLGGNRVMVVLFYRTEEDMRTFARSERSMICSDGSAISFDQQGRLPHPRSFGASARALGYLVRDRGDMKMETAIYKMTGMASQHFHIHDRGMLEVGKAADIVIFDPTTVKDLATFLDPAQGPQGIEYVIVNGEIVVRHGVQTPARPGKVLRAASVNSK